MSLAQASGRAARLARALLIPPLASRGFAPRYWLTVLLFWAVGVYVAVPIAIRAAHAGWLPFVGRLMAARRETPVTEYLNAWHASVPGLSFVGLTSALLLFLVVLLRRQVRVSGLQLRGRADGSEAGRLPLPALLLLATWFGLMTGIGEAYYLTGRAFVLGLIPPNFDEVSWDSLWMAPLVAVVIFTAVALVLFVGSRAVARIGSVAGAVLAFAFLTAFSWIQVTGRVTTIPALILAAGVAVQSARFAAANAESLRPLIRRSSLLLAGVVFAVAVGTIVLRPLAERRQVARLPEAPADALNVLLIVLDTQRARNTSLYGSARPTTPNLDRWADGAVVFDYGLSTATWTLPSHATMFTGRQNLELGTDWLVPLDDRYATLAEVLRDNGYTTAGFVANLGFGSDLFGLNRGFIHWDDQPRSVQMALKSLWLTRHYLPFIRGRLGNHRSLVRKRAEAVNRAYLRWLDDQPDRPFFAFLNYFDAHHPYLPPAPFDTAYAPRGALYYPKGGTDQDEPGSYTSDEIEQLELTYDSGISYLDHYLGRLFVALGERDLLEKTLVIVTADHGEEFGEHGHMLHGDDLFFVQVRVPLVVRVPGGRPGRVQTPVSLRDLAATILDVVGLDEPFPGRSLGRYLTSDAPVDPASMWAAFSQKGQDVEWSLVKGRYHYIIERDGTEQLYDFISDPSEMNDLGGQSGYAAVLSSFRHDLTVEVGSVAPERLQRVMDNLDKAEPKQ